jgi:5-hydroxyisourate hydrolase
MPLLSQSNVTDLKLEFEIFHSFHISNTIAEACNKLLDIPLEISSKSAKMKSAITTHVLDTVKGIPASGVKVTLFRQENQEFVCLGTETTNADGRCLNLTPEKLVPVTYKLRFDVKEYYDRQQTECFFPYVEVVFIAEGNRSHYHVPLVITPFAYNTYRGS